MGAAPATRLTLAAAVFVGATWPGSIPSAVAQPTCTKEKPSGSRFATCFDLGNRLLIGASTHGYGGAVELRHGMRFDDEPDLVWKMEHRILGFEVDYFTDRSFGVLYAGRYVRHARDGHILLPFGIDRKLFLPFDVGAEVDVGSLAGEVLATELDIGVIRGALLFDLARTDNFRRRVAIGLAAHWNMVLDRQELSIRRQRVAPFTLGTISAHAESATGITRGTLRIDAGGSWTSPVGWKRHVALEGRLERILVAINGRPLSVVAGLRVHAEGDARARVGIAFAPLLRRHPRVNLRPLRASR